MSVLVRQKSWSLSGMGGGYEDQCQRMLWRGVAYLAECRPPLEMWEQALSSPRIYGVLLTGGGGLKALEQAIIKPGDDVTGAMHQCVMSHLAYIHQYGTASWHEQLSAHRDACFDWEGEL